MKPRQLLWTMTFAVIVMSCRKEHGNPNPHTPPPPVSNKKILLKDIVEPHLPSPFYHFEYGPDSLVTYADFASGFGMYNVFYSGGRISEMRNNTFVNHDTLRYTYDNEGKVTMVKFITEQNVINRLVFFTYNGDQVTKIEFDHKEPGGFLIDRILEFAYFPDGNLKEMHQRRFSQGIVDNDYTTHFDKYDDKINVDDYTLVHDTFHDHFLILPHLHLQRNNPGKEWTTGDDNHYTVDYTYTYNSDNTPSVKTGDFVWTTGSQAGQHFTTNNFYSYY